MGCTSASDKTSAVNAKHLETTQPAGIKKTPSIVAPTDTSDKKSAIQWDPSSNYSSIRQRYKILDVVGHGKFGIIYKAESKADSSKIVAIKVLKNNCYLDRKSITEEIRILKELDHPNIVKYYEEIEDGPYIFIVTEFCSGGELFDRIAGKTVFNESEAAAIIEKLLCALNHCHSKGIAHRDIKPENILYTSRDEHAEVKLIDFGLAKRRSGALGYETMVGTPQYVAPEVIEGNYTCECDIWSLGVVLHVMLSGLMPFVGDNTEAILRSIQKIQLNFDHPVWNKVTPPAKDLLLKLLEPDAKKRLTAAEALKHEWFRMVKTYTPEIDELDCGIMSSMKQYQGTSKFQRACLGIFVKYLKEEEINNLVEAFHALDKERKGYIGTNDLLTVLHKYYPTSDMRELVAQMDVEGHGVINYSQFVASTLDAKQFLTKERLWALFQCFDIANNGYLKADDIMHVLNKSGSQQYTLAEVTAMLKEHKIADTNCIKFNQFADIMAKMQLAQGEDVFQKVLDEKHCY